MNATIYVNNSDKRVINKDLTQVSQFTIDILQPCSLQKPRLVLTPESNGLHGNYLYISEFERYYYIENQIMGKGRIILECKSDPLMSFWQQIKELDVVLEKAGTKSSRYWNMYLNDEDAKMYNYTLEEIHKLELLEGDGFSENVNNILLALTGSVSGV